MSLSASNERLCCFTLNSQTLAIKIYAILVNSMPDERTGSTLTWFNSPLRANQDVQTLVDMIQIGQWYGKSKART